MDKQEAQRRFDHICAMTTDTEKMFMSGCLIAQLIMEIPAPEAQSLQARVLPWLHACFGPEIASDPVERNHRFVEESLELAQACGCTASEAHQLVDYVFGVEVGLDTNARKNNTTNIRWA